MAKNNLQIHAIPLKQNKNASKTLTPTGKIETIIGKRIDRVMEAVSHIVNIKKCNRENLLDICGCTPEILVRSNTLRGIRKLFLDNVMIDKLYQHCPSFMKIVKICHVN